MESLRGLNGYFKRLKKALTCPRAQRRRFLSEARRMAEDFLQGNPDAAPEEVEAFLGPPQELARTFLDSLSPEEICRYRTQCKHVKFAGIVLAVVLFMCACAVSLYVLSQPMEMTIDSITVIYEEESNS